jgi:hypothetical protein
MRKRRQCMPASRSERTRHGDNSEQVQCGGSLDYNQKESASDSRCMLGFSRQGAQLPN